MRCEEKGRRRGLNSTSLLLDGNTLRLGDVVLEATVASEGTLARNAGAVFGTT
jgi:hypothetical protein